MGGKYAHKVVGEPVEFGAINGGEPFLAVLTRIDLYRTEGQTPAMHILLDLDYETYVRIDEAGAFGYSLFSVDPTTANAQFTQDRNMELTLRANDELLPEDAASRSDAELFDALLNGITDDSGRFLDPNAWKWLSVMQTLKAGSPNLGGIRSKYPPR